MSRREQDGGDPEALVEVAARHRRRGAGAPAHSSQSFSSSDHGRPGAAVATPPSSPPVPEDVARAPRRGRARVPLSTDTVGDQAEARAPRRGDRPGRPDAESEADEQPAQREKAKDRAGKAARAEQADRQGKAGKAGRRERSEDEDKAEDKAEGKAGKKRPRRAPAPDGHRRHLLARLGVWGIAACAVALVVAVLTIDAINAIPRPMPVSTVRVGFLPGPRLPVTEILRWVDGFPHRDQLRDPNTWELDQLAEYLRGLPAVDRVSQVTLVHEPGEHGSMHRVMEIDLALRRPVMPTVLASGERAWLDAGGHILPGILPGPTVRRPLVHGVEGASADMVAMAIECWQRLEPQLEPGLVTDLVLGDVLDERGTLGLVLYTRLGNRLIVGQPEEARYGITVESKVRELVHAIRCQGELARVAVINVRFGQAFYTVRPGILPAPLAPAPGAAATGRIAYTPSSAPSAPARPTHLLPETIKP